MGLFSFWFKELRLCADIWTCHYLVFFLMFAFVCCDFCDACCVVNVSWLDFFQFGGCIYVGTCLLRCRDY
jgi:hypothetical protein